MKGLCRLALAALFVAACGGENAITNPDTKPLPPKSVFEAVGVDPTTGARIETDLDDYSPGQTVHLTGSGWAPNEAISLVMTEAPERHADVTGSVVADASGAFSLDFYVVQPSDDGVTFNLTATGPTSGSVVTVIFTDGTPTVNSFTVNATTFTFPPSPPSAVATNPITVTPGAVVAVVVNASTVAGSPGNADWRSTQVAVNHRTNALVNFGTTAACDEFDVHTLNTAVPGLTRTVNYTMPSTPGTYDIRVRADRSDGCSGGGSLTYNGAIIVSAPANTPPTAEANGPYSVSTNTTIALSGVGSDDPGGSITNYAWTYSVVSAPGGSCTITNASTNSPTGATISCTQNGTYEVKLTVTDNLGATDDDVASLTVSNTAPTANVGGPYGAVPEGSSLALSGSGNDTDGSIAGYLWSWQVGSADPGAACTIVNPTSATTASISCNDDGTFQVKLTVTDDDGQTGEATVNITVTNAAPSVQATGGSGDEGSAINISASFTDAGTNDTHPTKVWSYTLGAGAAGTCSFGSSSALSTTITCTDNGTFNIKYSVTDDDGSTGEGTATVTVANVAPSVQATGGSGAEGSAINISASFTDAGTNDTHPTKVWSYTAGIGAEGTCTFGSSSASPTTITCTDDGSYTIKYAVTDDDGSTGEGTAVVAVANEPPVIGTITAPIDPVAVGPDNVTVSWNFTDPGADTWTCSVEWDTGLGFTSASVNAATKTCTATASLTPGLYSVRVKVADDDGGEDIETIAAYIVVYDPNGGFVTGGGWINSLAGYYRLDPAAAGKANFGFVSKYQPGKSLPQGNTEFQFHAGNLNFKSTVYEWLVVAGTKAMYKGEGTISGQTGVYGFLLSAIDGSSDKFRIKIWEKTSGTLIYDTLPVGAADDADPTTTLGGGSIVVHTKK